MTEKKRTGFDIIAPVYDPLARAVFGCSIRSSQTFFLDNISSGSNVLVLGGGTGWILMELFKFNPECCVWYIEPSRKMMDQAQRRVKKLPSATVTFILGTEESIPSGIKYDAVITNFYFDLFSAESLKRVLNCIRQSLHSHGIILVADFIATGRFKHRALLHTMYQFFRVVCGIETTRLPNWQGELSRSGFEEMKSKMFYNGFIKSSVYRNLNEKAGSL